MDATVTAMIHLPPLPGAGNYSGIPVRELIDRAATEADMLNQGGFSALMLQNTHDAPTRATVPPATLTAMAAIGQAVSSAFPGAVGINVHKNDGPGAVAVAHAIGAGFVRVKVLVGAVLGPEGILEGNADAVHQLRRNLGSDVEIWADLGELTSIPLAPVPLGVQADWAARFGGADRLIITEADVATSTVSVSAARGGTDVPILIGGRTTPENVTDALEIADGVIVGSYLRSGGHTTADLDQRRITQFRDALLARAQTAAR